ncbi:TIGR01777 family oxidoreductase [Agromyces aerolatus]|uniref:TIGR01777 family oxidoreductase n=1 Tax=Agromyces sp. LY-1074 TaxID=3074080 RepID=UPI002860374C|nr:MULTISPECIES: TIGR01777 family oxidoreductase [unclassified Agromyces]MDR5701033.1 TIGR01777 family oxidoreductase [Agromyces sp. LY-1074]MDR5707673.1 TIGR01777 family oxidoreductase [Agromyces sp. LY-1358]
MRILAAGASGFIGSALVGRLGAAGHEVVRLVRRPVEAGDEVSWSPADGRLDVSSVDGVDAVVSLSGASLAHLPWTKRYRDEILQSRISATRTLVDAMRAAARPPAVFLSASAVGIYGDRPAELLTEHSAIGTGFLADVVEQWEGQAALAPEATRTVMFRSGIVVGDGGGALQRVATITKLGLAGRLGSGEQHWPWIALEDEVRALEFLLESPLAGPVNLAGPTPATANEITSELAEQLHRPHALVVPERALELALGVAADELLLANQKVRPQRLIDAGFRFAHPVVSSAIAAMVSGSRAPG